MYVLVTDFKQAFDSADRRKTIQIIQEVRIQNKLVRVIKMTLQNTEASVKIENLTSKPFSISSGVRQGDPFSAIFNVILNPVIKKFNLRGDISLKLKQIVAYADDVARLARSPKALTETFHKLQNEANLVGLNIKEDKTKYMQIKRTGIKDITHLKIDNFAFENVENFNYLGSILNADNKMNTEIAKRIVKSNKAYYANAKLIKLKFLKRNTKMKIYKTIIRPVVTYSSETWSVTAKDENNLRIFERKIFGSVNIDNTRRIRNNTEIDKLIESADIQGVTGGMDQTSGVCSLGQTITI